MNDFNTLTDYYEHHGLNPVEHHIHDDAQFRAHELKRKNLIQYYLKMPPLLWRGAKVLEFGPASGENAVVTAHWGSDMTLVEPIDFLIDGLKANFEKAGVTDRIQAIHQDTVEGFETDERYDVVFAEGFVHFLEDHLAGIRKLSGFVAEDGFILLNLVHPSGTFIEFLKRVYLLYAARRIGVEDHHDQLELARLFYSTAFGNINNSRAFELWAQDTILNPLYQPDNFVEFDDVLEVLSEEGFYCHATWPNYLSQDDFNWHKNIKNKAQLIENIKDSYYSRFPHFMHSWPQQEADYQLFAPDEGRLFAKQIHESLAVMKEFALGNETSVEPMLESWRGLFNAFVFSSAGRDNAQMMAEVIALFEAAEGLTSTGVYDFAHCWNQFGHLSRSWGTPGHYVVFHKSDLFEG